MTAGTVGTGSRPGPTENHIGVQVGVVQNGAQTGLAQNGTTLGVEQNEPQIGNEQNGAQIGNEQNGAKIGDEQNGAQMGNEGEVLNGMQRGKEMELLGQQGITEDERLALEEKIRATRLSRVSEGDNPSEHETDFDNNAQSNPRAMRPSQHSNTAATRTSDVFILAELPDVYSEESAPDGQQALGPKQSAEESRKGPDEGEGEGESTPSRVVHSITSDSIVSITKEQIGDQQLCIDARTELDQSKPATAALSDSSQSSQGSTQAQLMTSLSSSGFESQPGLSSTVHSLQMSSTLDPTEPPAATDSQLLVDSTGEPGTDPNTRSLLSELDSMTKSTHSTELVQSVIVGPTEHGEDAGGEEDGDGDGEGDLNGQLVGFSTRKMPHSQSSFVIPSTTNMAQSNSFTNSLSKESGAISVAEELRRLPNWMKVDRQCQVALGSSNSGSTSRVHVPEPNQGAPNQPFSSKDTPASAAGPAGPGATLSPTPGRTGTCTIRFIGQTEFAPGVWVGVELDLPVGKHDGSVNGVQYFKARKKHALFVKPDRLQPFNRRAPTKTPR